jgi:DNA polymerase-3 subunit delta'
MPTFFLKILEEPPESATLILLTTNPYALLPTIRSRCVQFFFSPLQTEWVEKILSERTQIAPAERKLAAQPLPRAALARPCRSTWRKRLN